MRKSLLSLALVALASSQALALFVAVPLEILVDEADVIVTGKVARIKDGGFAIGNRKYDVAVVEVSSVLKSLVGKPKEVHIAQPAAGGGLAVSTDISFRPGQDGIWLLTRDPERDVYWAKHPSQFQEAGKQKELTNLIALREKLPGGTAVKGLVARAELVEHKPAKGPTSFEIRFSVKNVSEKPLAICDYASNQPVQVKWIGPNGKMLQSNHYAWLARADIAELMKSDFRTVLPGGVRFIGPRGQYSSIWFLPQPSAHANHAQVGEHQITISYANKEVGKQFGLDNVPAGTVAANEVTFRVTGAK